MKKTIFKTAVILLTAIMTISCSKDGAAGPAGANGTNGTNGTNGNANVIGSNTFTFSSTNWTSISGGTAWTSGITGATPITQNIVDKGIVSVFRMYTSGGLTVWAPLPDTNVNKNLTYDYGVGTINLLMQSTNGVAISNPGAMTLRYVVISPSNIMENPDTDWNNYNQVKEALHLQN